MQVMKANTNVNVMMRSEWDRHVHTHTDLNQFHECEEIRFLWSFPHGFIGPCGHHRPVVYCTSLSVHSSCVRSHISASFSTRVFVLLRCPRLERQRRIYCSKVHEHNMMNDDNYESQRSSGTTALLRTFSSLVSAGVSLTLTSNYCKEWHTTQRFITCWNTKWLHFYVCPCCGTRSLHARVPCRSRSLSLTRTHTRSLKTQCD